MYAATNVAVDSMAMVVAKSWGSDVAIIVHKYTSIPNGRRCGMHACMHHAQRQTS